MASVIITVRLSNSFDYDMEVSPNIPCGELALQVMDAIRAKEPGAVKHIGTMPCFSTSEGRRIPSEATLGKMGLWDGSILILGSDGL